MDGRTLIAEFGSAAVAARMGREVSAFLSKVAVELDRAAARAGGEWPEEATPAAVAFGKKYGERWEEPLTWGDGPLAGSEPEVGWLGPTLALFHDDVAGGYGAHLPSLLEKAGARVREMSFTPIVYGEIPIRPSSRAIVGKIAAWCERRLTGDPLRQWKAPPWSKRVMGFGRAADVAFVVDDATCAFTVPLLPSDFDTLRDWLAAAGRGVVLRVASRADEKAIAKRELAATQEEAKAKKPKPGPKPKKAKAKTSSAPEPAPASRAPAKAEATPPAAIPSKMPVVAHHPDFYPSELSSSGGTLYAVFRDILSAGRGPGAMTRLCGITGSENMSEEVEALAVDGDEVWAAGKRLWRSDDGGRSFTAQKLPPGVDADSYGKQFHGIARDPSGILWAGGAHVVTVQGRKVVHDPTFGKDARIKAIAATPYGALLLTFSGLAYLANDGRAKRIALRGKGQLSSACVTPRGTVIIVGSGSGWSAEIHRSEDGCATFRPVRVAKLAPLERVIALADGRLLAGSGTLLLCSTDDGKKWQTVKTPADRTFDLLCAHGAGAVGYMLSIA